MKTLQQGRSTGHPVPTAVLFFLLLPLLFGCASRYYCVKPLPPPLTIEDIVERSRTGVPDREIIREIDESGTVLYLRSAEIMELKEKEVSERVIDHLITVREWTLLGAWRQSPDTGAVTVYPPRTESRRFVPVSIH